MLYLLLLIPVAIIVCVFIYHYHRRRDSLKCKYYVKNHNVIVPSLSWPSKNFKELHPQIDDDPMIRFKHWGGSLHSSRKFSVHPTKFDETIDWCLANTEYIYEFTWDKVYYDEFFGRSQYNYFFNFYLKLDKTMIAYKLERE